MTDRQLRHFRLQDPFDSIMTALAEEGGVIVDDFTDSGLVNRLDSQLRGHAESTVAGAQQGDEERRRFWGDRTKRFSRLAARAPAFAELLDHEFMHRWAQHNLACDYWLNTGQSMIVGPGEAGQRLHRDIAIWPYLEEMGRAAPDVLVSAIVALSEFTEDVGATRVIPGSHLWGDFRREPNAEETVAAIMPTGGALLYLGKTVHAAGSNRSSTQWRHGLHMSFVVGWLTPEEASPIGVPWSTAQGFSPRVQRLLGYASPGPGNGRAPRNWLVDFADVRATLGVPIDR